MIVPHTYQGQRIAVFGLGRTGVSAALALQKAGAEVFAWDDNAASREAAGEQGVDLVDLTRAEWKRFDALLLSPGVPHALPEPHWTADKARAHDVPIICDVEVFVREMATRSPRPRIIAITGTNGKSTTTALTRHVLATAGLDAHMGGNIGRGVLDLPEPGRDTAYVLELSSYQLERTPSLRADVAVLLNLSPDHLDRHGDMSGYELAKRNIFANQQHGDAAVVGSDDATGKRIITEMKARNGRRIIPVSTRASLSHGVSVRKGRIYDAMGAKVEDVTDLSGVDTLRGQHNHQNAGAAFAVARALGIEAQVAARGLKSFPGLAHRMELVGRAGPVQFVNDSKATNADAARQALGTFEHVHWIAGGLSKAGGISEMADLFGRVSKAYLIGSSAVEFARTLEEAGVAHKICKTLDAALRDAARDAFAAGRKTVVLLSPACASFDQFPDFEARGDAFRNQARTIIDLYDGEARKRA